MKNLLHYLAHTFVPSESDNNNRINKPQNNQSCHGDLTFFTPDGDLLQMQEQYAQDCTYGVIQIQLRKSYIHLSDAECVLHYFLSGLQKHFQIIHTTEARYLISSKIGEHLRTVYWQDKENTDWKVQGWTNGQAMKVFYIKNINAVPVQQEDQFFGGIGRIAV